MIHPDKNISFTWNIILAALLIYTATIMPYRLAFVDPVDYNAWFFVEMLIDVLFFIDVIVNLLTAYYTSDGELITRRRDIFLTYLRSWMLLDIVACIPFNWIPIEEDEDSGSEGGRYNTFIRLLRLPRLYRIMKFSRIFKLVKVSYNSYLMKIQDYFKVR
jgi:hypothetical protein